MFLLFKTSTLSHMGRKKNLNLTKILKGHTIFTAYFINVFFLFFCWFFFLAKKNFFVLMKSSYLQLRILRKHMESQVHVRIFIVTSTVSTFFLPLLSSFILSYSLTCMIVFFQPIFLMQC